MTPSQFRRAALKLPEAVEGSHVGHPDFRVGNKIFATLGAPNDEWAMVKIPIEHQLLLIKEHPGAFRAAAGAWGRAGSTLVHLTEVRSAELGRVVRDAIQAAHRYTGAKTRPSKRRRAGVEPAAAEPKKKTSARSAARGRAAGDGGPARTVKGKTSGGSKNAGGARLAEVTRIALELPETSWEPRGDHAAYRVRKKIFAYFLNNHHGDGIVGINTKVPPGENTALIEAQPERFYMPAYIGPRGWVGLRLDHGAVDWDEVRELLVESYCQMAPRTLAAAVRRASVEEA